MSDMRKECRHGIDGPCPSCFEDYTAKIQDERDRYKAALDEIADGDGCNSKHGPGCDTRCKDIARRALAGGK